MDSAVREAVLKKLAAKMQGGNKGSGKEIGGRTPFRHAVEAAWKAVKGDSVDEFEKAIDAVVRIKLAERE